MPNKVKKISNTDTQKNNNKEKLRLEMHAQTNNNAIK